jgi:ABC-2 type transport system permease protein
MVPAGFDAEVDQGQGGSLEVIGDVDSSTSTQIATAIAESYGLGLDQIGLNVATAMASGGDLATVIPAATSGAIQPLADLTEITAGVRQLDGTTSTVAGMAVFFLLFTAQVGLLSLLEERRDGTLARMLSTPTRPSAVLAAKGLVSVVLGLTSLAVLIVAGKFILGAEWGNPAGVLVLVVAAVLAAVGISALTTGLAKTPESAGNMQGIVGTVLGLLGGVFFPIGDDGGVLASISALTPHHWFIRGLSDLAGGQSASAALPSVWPLLTIAAVTAFAASFLIRRQVSK